MAIDRSSWWWQKGRLTVIVTVTMVATSFAAMPLQTFPWAEMRARQPALNLGGATESLGQGAVLGLLGGFRSIIADFVWLRAYSFWEHRDRPNTETLINLATTLNPSSVFFWDDASNKIGYDIAAWRVEALPRGTEPGHQGDYATTTPIFNEQAQRALEILDRGLKFHPGNYRLLVDKALIYQYHMHPPDLLMAAENYRLAAEDPNCPFYAERIYARLLQDAHKNQQAYDYLRKLYFSTLKNGPIPERADDAWDQLMELENKLNLPPAQRLPLADAPPGWSPGVKPEAPAP